MRLHIHWFKFDSTYRSFGEWGGTGIIYQCRCGKRKYEDLD